MGFDKHTFLKLLGQEVGLLVFDTCESTNAYLLNAARNATVCAPTLVVANEQTAGRGRLGKSFFSPGKSGIYFSLLLPAKAPFDPACLTASAALDVCRAAEELGAPACRIKWVNDVYVNDKKACGILTQGVFSGEELVSAVVGIGLNVTPPEGGFPADIAARAGSFFQENTPFLFERFVALIVRRLLKRDGALDEADLNEYRSRSCVIGRRVEVLRETERFFAVATDIDDACRLLVEADDGTPRTLSSGDVSLVL